MVQRFLTAKAWQIFTLAVGIPMLFYFFMVAKMVASIAENDNPYELFSLFKYFPLIMFLVIGTTFGWMWSIGKTLHAELPEGVVMNLKRFKLALLFPFILVMLVSIWMVYFMHIVSNGEILGMNSSFMFLFAIVFPLQLFSMVCVFYSMYFVAQTMKAVELQRQVTFVDFAAEFFLIWFFIIGVWFLQPKINQFVNGDWPEKVYV